MGKLEEFLQANYGFEQFRPGQKEVLTELLDHKSLLAILPTGNGKSLCYQFYGHYTNQRVLIVSPLLALMQDQVNQMRYQGYGRVVALTSEQDYFTRRLVLENLASYQYIFLAPEILQNQAIMARLKQVGIGLLVVDEAHCISVWGPDFRPDYLKLGQLRQALQQPVTLALTATATPKVANDIKQQLGLTNVYRRSVNRPNIYLDVIKVADQKEKDQRLLQLVTFLAGPGLVYFSSKKLASKLARWLTDNSDLKVAAYHAGLSMAERYSVLQQFLQGQLDVVCATSAFGMGINKGDIRYVIHYHLTGDLNNYVQEIGRAGRDGLQSAALLLYQPGDEYLQKQLIDSSLPTTIEIEAYFKGGRLPKEKIRLLAGISQEKSRSEELTAFFEHRRAERLAALDKMVVYANSSGCLRQVILDYFDEKALVHKSAHCCHANALFETLTQLGLKKTEKRPVKPQERQGYEYYLQKLFANYQ